MMIIDYIFVPESTHSNLIPGYYFSYSFGRSEKGYAIYGPYPTEEQCWAAIADRHPEYIVGELIQ